MVVGGSPPVRVGRRQAVLNNYIVAGWSSSVARRAHNPKVAGSNPAPAIIVNWLNPMRLSQFFYEEKH
jgi:hypothetical protein